jgi:hypothetical protein
MLKSREKANCVFREPLAGGARGRSEGSGASRASFDVDESRKSRRGKGSQERLASHRGRGSGSREPNGVVD